MEGKVSQSGSRQLGFVSEGDIRSKHDAIMRISEVVLDEIQRNDLAIADTLEKTAGVIRSRDCDHRLIGRAPNSLGRPLNYNCNSSLGSEIVEDFSALTTGATPNTRPTNPGNMMTSNRGTNKRQDTDTNIIDSKTAEWEGTLSKNVSHVLDLLPPMLKKSPYGQSMFSHEMPMYDYASELSGLLPHETHRSRQGESPMMGLVNCEIPDDTTGSEKVLINREETALSNEDPLSLLDLLPDVPKEIMNICWRYQHLDDGQLENMRHYMIAKAFGLQGKVLEESVSQPSV